MPSAADLVSLLLPRRVGRLQRDDRGAQRLVQPLLRDEVVPLAGGLVQDLHVVQVPRRAQATEVVQGGGRGVRSGSDISFSHQLVFVWLR